MTKENKFPHLLAGYPGRYGGKLSIVIVTRNSLRDIERCLSSIKTFFSKHLAEVVVVDNHSSDDTAGIVSGFNWATLVPLKENTGFARAANVGVKLTKGPYILLLNPDVEIQNDFFSEVRSIFERDPLIGIIGPRIVYPNGTLQQSVRRFPDILSQVVMLLKLDHLYSGFRTVHRYLASDFDYTKGQYADQVMGACFFTKRKLWDELQGFDEHFFIWFEEVDYCLRAAKSGMRTFYAPVGPVRHALGRSFEKESFVKKQWWFLKSLAYFFMKHSL